MLEVANIVQLHAVVVKHQIASNDASEREHTNHCQRNEQIARRILARAVHFCYAM